MSEVRVRFAPSPTGPLHIGGVRTALYNYLFAKNKGGKFILRIEDTDQARFVEGAEQYIFESLKWCGIEFDESVVAGGEFGPYKQSEREAMYLPYAEQLVKDGFAYYAFDSSEELTAMRERMKAAGVPSPQYNAVTRTTMQNSLALSEDEVTKRRQAGEAYVIRIKMPRNEEVKLNDIIRGWVVVNTNNMDDKVIFKSDGMPTYHLANVVDDYLMKISHVIRGEEWLPSAPLHVLLYRYLGWEDVMPQFAHLPLILKPVGKGKLSKRDGDKLGFPVFPLRYTNLETGNVSEGYKESGYFAEAFINMLALLGWNPGTEEEVFSLDQLTKAFDLNRVSKSGAKFNPEKTNWFNQRYMQTKGGVALTELYLPVLKEKEVITTKAYANKVVNLIKERAVFVEDFWGLSNFFFQNPTEYNSKASKKNWKEDTSDLMRELIIIIEGVREFSSANTETIIKEWISEKDVGLGKVMQPLRLSLVGDLKGPHLFDIMEMIGKMTVVTRINNAIVFHS